MLLALEYLLFPDVLFVRHLIGTVLLNCSLSTHLFIHKTQCLCCDLHKTEQAPPGKNPFFCFSHYPNHHLHIAFKCMQETLSVHHASDPLQVSLSSVSLKMASREEVNLFFVRSKTSIRCISNEEARALTDSKTLADIWIILSEAELVSLAREVALTIKQLRRLANVRMVPRTHPEEPNLRHSFIFEGFDFSDIRYQERNSSIFRELARAMEMVGPIESRFYQTMPNFAPFIFTHGDLRAENIIVDIKTRTLAHIAGWQNAEYAPVFWEYTSLLWDDLESLTTDVSRDRRWKGLLRIEVRKHEEIDLLQAGNWIKALGTFRQRHYLFPQRMDNVLRYLDPDSDEFGYEELEPEYYGHLDVAPDQVTLPEGGELRTRKGAKSFLNTFKSRW